MPAPGDQHRDTPATVNPFLPQTPHISEYTAQQVATLQSRLEKQLGPEYISTRPGNGGGKVHYLAAEKVINLANEVFGFNGWSSSIQNVQIDFVDENSQSGRINLGLSTIVRVTLKDGTFHEDIGYGHCENTKGKAAAFEKAKKEAATDAMKRALRNFGNVLGNCLYDKDYLQKITKVKVAPSRWDAENLHRHPDFAPVKKEPIPEGNSRPNKGSAIQRNVSAQSVQSRQSLGSGGEFEDDFGEDMDETDFSHPDEVRLDDSVTTNDAALPANQRAVIGQQQHGQRHGMPRTDSVPQMKPPNIQPPLPVQGAQGLQKPQGVKRPPQIGNGPPPQYNGLGTRSSPSSGTATNSSTEHQPPRQIHGPNAQAQGQPNRPDQTNEESFPVPRQPPQGIPDGFVTGRKAELLNQNPGALPPNANLAFNPHADSPSIRRTQGVNPGKSAPIRRMDISGTNNGGQSPMQQQPTAAGGLQSVGSNGLNGTSKPTGANYVNPSADMNRKIGMPQPGGAPGGGFQRGAGAYKPPSAVKRPAMADVTNTHGMDGASDPKKAKLDGGGENEAEAAEQDAVAS